jgi:hypothetical protein
VYRVRFIITVLAIPALVILVWGLLCLRLVTLLCIRLVLRRVLTLVSCGWILRVLLLGLWLLWLVWRLDSGAACMREHFVAGMTVLAIGRVACVA